MFKRVITEQVRSSRRTPGVFVSDFIDINIYSVTTRLHFHSLVVSISFYVVFYVSRRPRRSLFLQVLATFKDIRFIATFPSFAK